MKTVIQAILICILFSCEGRNENNLIGNWQGVETNSLATISAIDFIDDQNCIIYMSGIMAMLNDKSYCTYKQLPNQVILCDNTQGSIILTYEGPDMLVGRVAMMNIKLVRTKN